MSEQRVVIVGAGIGGLAAAVALARAGVEVQVLERDQELHEVGAVLGVASNAMKALRELGLAEHVAAIGSEVRTLEHRTAAGRVIARWPTGRVADRLGEPILAASRPALLSTIAAGVPDGVVSFGARCTGASALPQAVCVHLHDRADERGALLIGADGASSSLRAQLSGAKLRYAGYTEWRGLVDLPGLAPAVQVQSYGRGLVFGMVPLAGGVVGWFGRWAAPAGGHDAPGASEQALRRLFGHWHEPIPAVIEACTEQSIARADIFDLPDHRDWGEGRMTLLGDAAHASQPTLGQGAAQAIEDAMVLARCVSRLGLSVEALREYERLRVPRTSTVVATSARQAAMNRWRRPRACQLRDALLGALPTPLALREFEKIVRFDG